MNARADQPTNLNYLSPLGFKFTLRRSPTVNYFCQSVDIPAISMTPVNTPTPVGTLIRPGDKIVYEPLTLSFRVDEDMKNYIEIVNWIEGLGHPNSLQQTRDLSRASPLASGGNVGSMLTLTSDATLTVLTSHKNAGLNAFFSDVFPTSLSALRFTSMANDVEYLEATATFSYRKYTLERI
jgi:hypothetical protein